MSVTMNAALAALAYSIINEQDGYSFYLAVSARVKDAKGKAFFKGLANDEAKHFHLLMAEYLSLSGGGTWLSFDQAMTMSVPTIGTFKADLKELAGYGVPGEPLFTNIGVILLKLDAGTGDIAAIDLALDTEKRGYNLYKAGFTASSDANAKAAYELLMKEENNHYDWLQMSRGYLTANNLYWDDTELPFFEG